jgi:hypothetical protein
MRCVALICALLVFGIATFDYGAEEPSKWNWDASCSIDAWQNVLYGSFILFRGWQACPSLEDPGAICPIYERTAWLCLAATPALRLDFKLPDPGPGGVSLLTLEAEDFLGNISPPDDVDEGETCPSARIPLTTLFACMNTKGATP